MSYFCKTANRFKLAWNTRKSGCEKCVIYSENMGKTGNIAQKDCVTFYTKKSKIFLAKKRKNFLPFAEECDTISKSRLRHDMRWSGRLRLNQPVFPWSMSDFKPGDKNMRGAGSRAFGLLLAKGAPCRNHRRRISGLGNGLTASQTFFICPHPDSA